jgi:integrase
VKLRHVHVYRTRAKTNGGWQVDLPKTPGSDREVPLPGWLATDLAAYLAAHPRRHDPAAPLWPGRHRYPDLRTRGLLNWDEPWERGVFAKSVFKPALVRAGLPATVRLHDLRHTYISILASKGVPAYRIAKYAGHADVHTTLAIYTHLFKTDEAADMELLTRTPTAASQRKAAGTVLQLT